MGSMDVMSPLLMAAMSFSVVPSIQAPNMTTMTCALWLYYWRSHRPTRDDVDVVLANGVGAFSSNAMNPASRRN